MDLNVNAKTINLLKEKTGENFCDLGLGKYYLHITLKARLLKAKTKLLNWTSPKNFFLFSREHC